MMIIGLLECAVGHSTLIAFHQGVYNATTAYRIDDVRFKLDIEVYGRQYNLI